MRKAREHTVAADEIGFVMCAYGLKAAIIMILTTCNRIPIIRAYIRFGWTNRHIKCVRPHMQRLSYNNEHSDSS